MLPLVVLHVLYSAKCTCFCLLTQPHLLCLQHFVFEFLNELYDNYYSFYVLMSLISNTLYAGNIQSCSLVICFMILSLSCYHAKDLITLLLHRLIGSFCSGSSNLTSVLKIMFLFMRLNSALA